MGIAPDKIVPDADAWDRIRYETLVDYMIDWFTDVNDPINLGLLYFDEPDITSHKYGTGSPEVVKMIHRLNDALGYLIDRLKEKQLYDNMNIIITADHGFTDVTEVVALSEYALVEHKDYETGSDFRNQITLQFYPTNMTGEGFFLFL